MNRPKQLGTSAENAVVTWLQVRGHPYAERRSLNGAKDKGDVTGIPGICIEVKVAGRRGLLLGPWLRETETERVNANAAYGILVAKPTGLGPKRTGQWLAAMYHDQWAHLVRDGGWPVPVFPEDHMVSGTKVNKLPSMLPDWSKSHQDHGPLLVQAVGKSQDPANWYVVATLEYMNRRLIQAGYGSEYDSQVPT